MTKIGFITNTEKDPMLLETSKLVRWAEDKGCEIFLPNTVKGKLSANAIFCEDEKLCAESDFVVVLGGDGTILRAARLSAIHHTPLLGINFGTLGYLADVEKKDALDALETVISGKATVEKRMMLEAVIEGKESKYMALNEISITNSVFSKMITLGVEVSGAYLNTFRADGIIIATPTGSTAYNLSAGGPILSPYTELIAITHICPHALYSRPMVVSGDDVIKISIKTRYSGIMLSCDGQNSVSVNSGDVIVIKRSEHKAVIMKTSSLNFYDILRRKMVDIRL